MSKSIIRTAAQVLLYGSLIGCSGPETLEHQPDPPIEPHSTLTLLQSLPVHIEQIAHPEGAPRWESGRYLISATEPRAPAALGPLGARQAQGHVQLGIDAVLPKTASEPVIIRARGQDARRVGISRIGAREAPAHLEGNVIVYPDAAPNVDAFFYKSGHQLEELLLVRDAGAVVGYAINLPAGSQLRASHGKLLEILDEKRSAWLRARFDRAWDRHGAPTEVGVETEGTKAYVRLLGSPALPVLVDPTWEDTDQMYVPRASHAATRLLDGRVLITGGRANPLPLDSAELYDPESQTFTTVPTLMTAGRYAHTSTLLPSGKVFIAGGFGFTAWNGCTDCRLRSTELYDMESHSFDAGPEMYNWRAWHTATTIPSSGQVVILGGQIDTPVPPDTIATAETYTADGGMGTLAPSSNVTCEPRYSHSAVLLKDDRILVTGGITKKKGGDATTSAEMFDPITQECQSLPFMPFNRSMHTATLLDDGDVLIAGGGPDNESQPWYHAERFSVKELKFSSLVPMNAARGWHTSTRLSNGWVLLVGGNIHDTASTVMGDFFDSSKNKFYWTEPAPSGLPIGRHTATELESGAVLLAGGGSIASPSRSAALFKLLDDGFVCIVGGECQSGFCADGVCCSESCDGVCQACTKQKTGLPDGVCAFVPTGTDPDNECSTDQIWTCGENGMCDGQGHCELYPAGTDCGDGLACPGGGEPCPPQCYSAVECIAGFRCDADGQCVPDANVPAPAGCQCTGASSTSFGQRAYGLALLLLTLLSLKRRKYRQN